MAREIARKDFDEEAELERLVAEVQALTPEELDQELRDEGIDPDIQKERLREIFFEVIFDYHSKLTPPGHG